MRSVRPRSYGLRPASPRSAATTSRSDRLPICVELPRTRIEKQEAGRVRWSNWILEVVRAESLAQLVRVEDVEASVVHERRDPGQRVHDAG